MTTMISEENRLVSVLKYLGANKSEDDTSFLLGVIMTTGDNAFARSSEYGHFTASAFVVNKDMTKVLLIEHLKHNMWLIPGGHIDDDESALAASIRETEEEVGIKISDLTLLDYKILDIDVHRISEDVTKCEPSHFHYDVRYIFKLDDEALIEINKSEAKDYKWIDISEVIDQDNHLSNVARKAQAIIKNK